MKNLVFLSIFLLVFSFLAIAQKTKTITLQANKRVTSLVIFKGDTVIVGGEFDSPYPHVAGTNIATGEVFSLGSGLPDTINNLFFVPWIENILFASVQKAPYLYTYDLGSPSSDWIPDSYFGITSKINDVDTIFNKIVISTDEGTLIMNESNATNWFQADSGHIAQCVSFNHTSMDGSFYVNERTGTSFMNYESRLYKIAADGTLGEKTEMNMGYVTKLFYMTDLDWYNGKLMLLGGVATIPDNGVHTELVTLSPTSENWTSFTHGDDCPGVDQMSVHGENLYVTGMFFGIDNVEVGPLVAQYDGDTWMDPFASYSSGIGYAIETEVNGKWTVVSGFLTQTEPSPFTQIIVFGTDIPEFTGTNEPSSGSFEINLFPNPANDHIEIKGPANGHVVIYDLLGKIVSEGVTNSLIETKFPAGQYFARVSFDGAVLNKVFIVQH